MAIFYEVLVSYDIEDNKNRKKLFEVLKDKSSSLLSCRYSTDQTSLQPVQR